MKPAFFLLIVFSLLLTGCSPAPLPIPDTGPMGPTGTPTVDMFAEPPTATPSPTPRPTATPDPLVLQNFAEAKKLGHGVNFGNTLEAGNEGDWGVTLQPEYFQQIRLAGFQTVRVPICWACHAADQSPYTIDSTFLKRIDWVVEQGSRNSLNVILDMHSYTAFMSDSRGQEVRYLAMWQQIAEHFKSAPANVYFELLNEPDNQVDPVIWNDILVKALHTVRQSNPTRPVIVGGVNWNAIDSLPVLNLPADDHHIIVTFHYYAPMQFTHQGVSFFPGADKWVGTTWSASGDQKASLDYDFQKAIQWAKASHRPLFVGEFGSNFRADMPSREQWSAEIAQICSQNGIPWAYWSFGGEDFGLFDIQKQTWDTTLLQALGVK